MALVSHLFSYFPSLGFHPLFCEWAEKGFVVLTCLCYIRPRVVHTLYCRNNPELFSCQSSQLPLADEVRWGSVLRAKCEVAGSHFSLYFTHWDRWCGTQHPAYRHADMLRPLPPMRLTGDAVNS